MMMTNDSRNWQVSISNSTSRVEGIDDIAQCVYLILTTIEGSDPLRPDFGSKIYKYMDKPMNTAQPMLVYAAVEAVGKWEKRISVTACRTVDSGAAGRQIIIEAVVVANSAQITIKANI